ncbi:Clp protease N-terminal domain-containing protein [Candidatus Daviesbacteria bacterium]|nr:Clp protease N-terminal domain-containing protein [Candidatus Daviesbacteria bacterium]
MREWIKAGDRILTRGDIPQGERELMIGQLEAARGTYRKFRQEELLATTTDRDPEAVRQLFDFLYPEFRGRDFSFDLQATLTLDCFEVAKSFNHQYIGTEHLILAMLHEGCPAAPILSDLGVNKAKVHSAVEFMIERGDRPTQGFPGLTPRARTVIEHAGYAAQRLEHLQTTGEHLLLGLVLEGENIGASILESLGHSLTDVREAVLYAQFDRRRRTSS